MRESTRAAIIVGAVVLTVTAFGLIVGADSGAVAAPQSGPAFISLSAAGVDTVEIDGIAGQVSVTAASSTGIGDAGSSQPLLHRLDSGTHTLQLFCPGNGKCPAAVYTVTIPKGVGLTLNQVSGQTALTGLSGPVDITASSDSVTATGLDTGSFTASITSGELNAEFTAPPRQTVLTVISADATLSLPGTNEYTVVQHVTSGNIDIGVPQGPNTPHVIDATVVSGEISLGG